MTNSITPNTPQESKFVLYTDDNNQVKIEVFIQDENIWLTQKKMAELFGVSIPTINEHLKNIYDSNELEEKATLRKFLTVQNEGNREVNRELSFYNLDAIISVGYRVNSTQATQFRIWATTQLRELMIKGFVIDDEKLKQAKNTFGQDYFKELLERVRSIRASERRIWLQITDIFKECSIDYNPKSVEAKDFFASIQNKFHFAITGQTAAEIIYQKADHNEPKMGLTTYKNSPNGRVLKSDVEIAKNYLSEKDIKSLERTVSSFFDYIEGIIERQDGFNMTRFAESVDKFLSFNEYKVLDNKGTISHNQAITKAQNQYDIFNKTQKIDSDFEKFVQKTKNLKQ
jgi:hypothetical protein